MQTLTVSEKCRVSTQTIKFPEEKRKNKILNCYPLSSYPTVLKSASMPYFFLQVWFAIAVYGNSELLSCGFGDFFSE